VTLAECVEFAEKISGVFGKRGQVTWGATGGERLIRPELIRPELAQDFDQVRFAAAVEAADPNGGLLLLFDVVDERLEHHLQAAGILALANEHRQFLNEDAGVGDGLHFGDPLVGQAADVRIFDEDFGVFHRDIHQADITR